MFTLIRTTLRLQMFRAPIWEIALAHISVSLNLAPLFALQMFRAPIKFLPN